MEKGILILGAGGHAKVLISCLKLEKQHKLLGILDIPAKLNTQVLGVAVIGHEDDILSCYSPSQVKLVNGIGSTNIPTLREKIYNQHKKNLYAFYQVIHQTAYVAEEVTLGEGVQLMAGSIIQPGTYIGNNSIINSQASVDHDCHIADHVHLAPGVVCSGGVKIGRGSHIGTGAVILQGISIGENCLIAAGAVVTRNVASGNRVSGIPAINMAKSLV